MYHGPRGRVGFQRLDENCKFLRIDMDREVQTLTLNFVQYNNKCKASLDVILYKKLYIVIVLFYYDIRPCTGSNHAFECF